MSKWADDKLAAEYDIYITNLIKVSQMIEDRCLSSTNGNKLFSEVVDMYRNNVKRIQLVDTLEFSK